MLGDSINPGLSEGRGRGNVRDGNIKRRADHPLNAPLLKDTLNFTYFAMRMLESTRVFNLITMQTLDTPGFGYPTQS